MWLKELKISLIEKNIDKMSDLLGNLPHLEDPREIEEAIYLLKESTEYIESLKSATKASMKQMKRHMDFLGSTEHNVSTRLDITS